MTLLDDVLTDLAAEGEALEQVVVDLDESDWRRATPAPGWDLATQVVHLAWTDEVAGAAATDKGAWDALVLRAVDDPEGFVDAEALAGGRATPPEILHRWQAARPALQQALRDYPQGEKLPWFGPPMSPTSMATARFMETWAHALDVYEALGITYEPTDRIRHVAHPSHAWLLLRQQRPRAACRGTARRAHRPLGRGLGVGSSRCGAAGLGVGPRLLPAGDPAAPPRRPRPGRRG